MFSMVWVDVVGVDGYGNGRCFWFGWVVVEIIVEIVKMVS